ncbi:MAG TPA: MFS transporter [Coxiellaceae bacterium]|nr:MFS transporter [Coxiellaceae bacterium]
MTQNSNNPNLYLKLLFTKLISQSLILGIILGLFVKQFFSFNSVSLFAYVEVSLIFTFCLGILTAGHLSENQGRIFLVRCVWVLLSLLLLLLSITPWFGVIWIELALSFFAIGAFITLLPVYSAECAPSLSRGAWVISNFLALLLGVSLFVILDFKLQWAPWIECLLASGLSLMAFILSCYLAESPAWLLEQARIEEAKEVLEQLRLAEEITKEIAVMKSSIRRRPRTWQLIYERQLRNKFKVSRYLAVFRQLTGVGVILLYLPQLFLDRWPVTSGVLWILIFISVSTGLLFAAIYVDSVGRRTLTTFSFLTQTILLLALLTLSQFKSQFVNFDLYEMLLILSFLFFFALGAGPVTWLSWIELMPLRSRVRYLATFLLISLILGIISWLIYYVVINLAGIQWFYAIAAFFAFIATFYCWYKMPETKNYLLDEI